MTALDDQLKEWIESLRSLQQLVEERAAGEMEGEADNSALILQKTNLMQPQFQRIIAAIEAADLSGAAEQKIGSYQTEAHRRLRLLSVEGMKLKTARQPKTVAQVRSRLKDHLDQLQQFMTAIANEL